MTANRVTPTYLSENAFETRVLTLLGVLDHFLETNQIEYALFGSLGVAAFIGHLPRKPHDIDILVHEPHLPVIQEFLVNSGFERRSSRKSAAARFVKFTRTDGVYDLIVSIFPGKFTLLDLSDDELRPHFVYNFEDGIRHRLKRTIVNIGNGSHVSAWTVPFVDLLISKLWPTFEPNTVHDLIVLLACKEAAVIDYECIKDKIQAGDALRSLCLETLTRFAEVYKRTSWYRLVDSKQQIDVTVAEMCTRLRDEWPCCRGSNVVE